METKFRIVAIVVISLAVGFDVCGCKNSQGLIYDKTFCYMCKSQIGPITCGATNMADAINTLFTDGNESLSSNGSPYGISVVYHPEAENDRTSADSVTLPPCPIHDACIMMAQHYNLSYFYQRGLINFSDMPEVDKAGVHCARCEYGLCDSAEIGPFHFDCESMASIVREVCTSGNLQLRESGHSVFFLAQLVHEGPIQYGRTIHVEKGRVHDVLLNVARSLDLKLACDADCFYLYNEESEIRSLGRSILLIPDARSHPE